MDMIGISTYGGRPMAAQPGHPLAAPSTQFTETVTKTGVTNLSRWTASELPLVSSNSVLSDVIAGSLTIPGSISSIATTQGTEVAVYSFEVRDGGASGDPDATPTIINSLTINQGSANAAADWTQYIQGANLFDGVTDLGAATVHATSLTWSGAPIVSVPDNGNKTLTLKIYLKASLPVGADNKLFEFKINGSTDIVVDGSGSGMVSGESDVVGAPGTSIGVVAAKLNFVGTLGYTHSGWTFSASVSGTDTNGNISAEFTSPVTVALASGSGVLTGTIPKSAVSGVAPFTDLSIAGHGLVTLSATYGLLTAATSNSFAVDSTAAVQGCCRRSEGYAVLGFAFHMAAAFWLFSLRSSAQLGQRCP